MLHWKMVASGMVSTSCVQILSGLALGSGSKRRRRDQGEGRGDLLLRPSGIAQGRRTAFLGDIHHEQDACCGTVG